VSFIDFGLSPEAGRGTQAMGFVEPTPIQLRAFPILTLLAKHGAFRCSHVAGSCLAAYSERSPLQKRTGRCARTIFGGLIRVEPHAHFTDEYQKVRNLLLSDDAEANSMPGLEILADNVRCTHGATSGQIDEDELFYLRTRGIPTKTAQRLLVTGFLDEVIQRLDHAAISDHLQRLIEEKFAA
jgi:Fe-S cluster assembly scaffold protein SufB